MRCRSAQQHQEESHQWKSARRLRRFFFSFRSSPDVCSEVIYLRAFQRGCPLARVFRAFPGTLPARPLFIRVFEAPVRKSFIHAGFRVAARKRPTYGGFRGDTEKRTVYAGLRACPSAYSITTKHTTPLGAAAGAGAWRKQGLDFLSASELSSPPPGGPRQGKPAPGVAVLC